LLFSRVTVLLSRSKARSLASLGCHSADSLLGLAVAKGSCCRSEQAATQPDRSQGYCSCTGVRRKQRGQQFRLGNEELCLRQRPRTACATSRVRIQCLGESPYRRLGRGSVVGTQEVYEAWVFLTTTNIYFTGRREKCFRRGRNR